MSTPPRNMTQAQPKTKPSRRWVLALAVSALLHFVLIRSGSSLLAVPGIAPEPSPIVMVQLKPLPALAAPIVATRPILPHRLPVRRQPSPKAAKHRVAASQPQVPDMPITETRTPIPAPIETLANAAPPPSPALDGAESTGTAEPMVPSAPTNVVPNATPNAVHYDTKPPPSAELKYDVEALNKGQTYHGGGKITWQTDGAHYTINGEAGVLFISALDFKSEGEINDYGVAPVLYTEKKFRKPVTSTHFQHAPDTITFSASEHSYPRTGGEQDRASIVWQLASIGRGDPGKIIPGAVIDVFVAGDKDAETWRFQILGQENLRVNRETVTTWHLARKPQPGSYEKTLDIWLAPQREWYPVKLRFTENNGDYLDMSLSKLKELDALPLSPG